MRKRKICWITADNFIQDDEPIICKLKAHFEINWFVVFSKNFESSNYNEEYILKYEKQYEIKTQIIFLENRLRHPKTIRQYIKLLSLIKRESPSFIYCNILGYPYFYPLLLITFGRNKVIYAIHDMIDHYKIPNRKIIQIYKKFIFITFKHFQTFSLNQFILFTKKYRDKKVFMSPLSLHNYGDSFLQPPNTCISFLFFGLIRENKGLKYLIEAGNNLALKYKGKFSITIAGKCNEWMKYEKMIKCDEIFRLLIHNIPNSEIPELFNSAHYLVLPYVDVTQSGPLLTAFNYNIPVIASDLPGFSEYISDCKNSYLFESESSKALEYLMEKIIVSNNYGYNELKINLKKYVNENISIDSIVKKYLDYFNYLMD